MLVDSMIADLWNEASCKEEVINNPDVEAFKAALESLDGIKRTLLSLQCKNGRELVIGGGEWLRSLRRIFGNGILESSVHRRTR